MADASACAEVNSPLPPPRDCGAPLCAGGARDGPVGPVALPGNGGATPMLLGGSSSWQPTETLVSTHSTDTPFRTLAVNQFVVQSLMIPLAMIMGDKFRDSPSMMALAERNQAVQTFLFDRADEPFGVGVGIGRPIRCLDDANPRVLQARPHRLTPLGIPVADQHATPSASASVRFRTIWHMNASSGCGVEPRIWTRREASSITKTV